MNVPGSSALEADPGKKEAAAETAADARNNSCIKDLPAVSGEDAALQLFATEDCQPVRCDSGMSLFAVYF